MWFFLWQEEEEKEREEEEEAGKMRQKEGKGLKSTALGNSRPLGAGPVERALDLPEGAHRPSHLPQNPLRSTFQSGWINELICHYKWL